MPFWINILVGLLAFVIAALGGKALLPWLHKLKFGQPIKVNFGPSWHANKQGTPTMGASCSSWAASWRPAWAMCCTVCSA